MASSTAAGSKLAISAGTPASENAAGYAALTYTNIKGIANIGTIGESFEVVRFQPLDGPVEKYKGSVDSGSLSPQYAIDKTDAGQTLLRTAGRDRTNKLYAFEITFSDGVKAQFGARVFGNPKDVGDANSIVTAAPAIEICTDIYEVAAT